MGLIRSAIKAGLDMAGGVVSDQWKEYFYSPSLGTDVLVKKGEKRTSSKSLNTKGSSNIISNGSLIAVNEGQCMIIVEQGVIVEVCAEPGEFIYDTSSESSVFQGDLGQGVINSFKTFGRRFTFGGDTGKDQRVYFFNTKSIIGNKYGTVNPVPFRVLDQNIGLDIEIALRCHGEYSYKLVDPILFFKNISGNVEYEYTRDRIDSQLKTELLTALQPAFAKIAEQGIRYYQITGHTQELADALNEVLSSKWGDKYGIAIDSFGVSSVTAPKEDEEMIKELQRNAVFRNTNMAAAHLVSAQADAMKSAASNTEAGPMMAFAGMNMANNAGGMNAQQLFQMGQQPQQPQEQQWQQPSGQQAQWQQSQQPGRQAPQAPDPQPASQVSEQQPFQGHPVVAGADGWDCSCGAKNKGKFCTECGKPKPAGVPQYKCDKCGWEPEKGSKAPKFCPECGDPFDDGDIVK